MYRLRIRTTTMACAPDPVTPYVDRFESAFGSKATYAIDSDGDTLRVEGTALGGGKAEPVEDTQEDEVEYAGSPA